MLSKMSSSVTDVTEKTQNNSALDDERDCFQDTVMNVVAESLVQNVLQGVEHTAEDEEQFFDVTTGLENCKLADSEETVQLDQGKDQSEKAKIIHSDDLLVKPQTYDSSLTDDEIEVICRYSSPNVAEVFKKEIEEAAKSDQDEIPDSYYIDNVSTPKELSSDETITQTSQFIQDDIGSVPYSQPIMYVPPECYMSPSNIQSSMQGCNDPNYFSTPLMYTPTGPDPMFPPHMLESEVLQLQAQTCEQLERGYYPFSNGEPQTPMCPPFNQAIPPPPVPPFNNAQFQMPGPNDINPSDGYSGEPCPFVYPSIYVSTSGLITVLLKHDVSVEMTLDRTVRIVSHQNKMAVASSSRGNISILFHPAVKLYQDGNITNVKVNGVNVKMGTEDIWFANSVSSFMFDSNMIEPVTPNFRDMSKDDSVNLLFSADTYGEKLVSNCLEAASQAEYENLPKGGVQIRINNVKITQSGRGDVIVVTGPKYLKMSPSVGLVRINTHYVEVTVEKDLSTRVRKGGNILAANDGQVMLSNGRIEAGFDSQRRLKVWSLPGRSPLEVGVRRQRKQYGPLRRKPPLLDVPY